MQELRVIITTNTQTQPENFKEILQISRRFPGFPGVLDTLNKKDFTVKSLAECTTVESERRWRELG